MKIIIVDDHVLVREGIAGILRAEPDMEIAGLAGSVREAIELARQARPDIILMDYSLPDGTGVEAARQILGEQPECKIIFLTIREDDESLFSGIRAGAKGYLLKNIRPSRLVATLRAVQQGESALSRGMTLRLMEELSHTEAQARPEDAALARLTRREMDVLGQLASGKSNQEIAEHLVLAVNTVKSHVHSILEKLDLADRQAAGRYAREHGLTSRD